MWFPNRFDTDTNRSVQSQKMARSLNFGFKKKRKCTIRVAKTKTLISFAVAAKLICVFVFAYTDCWFSHEADHILLYQPKKHNAQRVHMCYLLVRLGASGSVASLNVFPRE